MLISRREDRVLDNNRITLCCLQSLSGGCPKFMGVLVEYRSIGSMTLTLLPGANSYSEPWALCVYLWLFFHKLLSLLSIEIYLLIFWLLTVSPNLYAIYLCWQYLNAREKDHIFWSSGDFIENTLFSSTLSKLLDRTNPNIKDERPLLLTFSHLNQSLFLAFILLFLLPRQFGVCLVFF